MVGDADIAFPRILVLPDISRPELDGLGPRVAVVSCFVVIFEGGIRRMYMSSFAGSLFLDIIGGSTRLSISSLETVKTVPSLPPSTFWVSTVSI